MSVIAPQDVSRSRWLQVGWACMLVGALLAAANAVLFMSIDAYGHPGIKSRFIATEIAGWMHALGGAMAVVLGPWQFLGRVRARWPRVHVWTGRAYLLAVLSARWAGYTLHRRVLAATPVSSASASWRCSGCTPERKPTCLLAAANSWRTDAG